MGNKSNKELLKFLNFTITAPIRGNHPKAKHRRSKLEEESDDGKFQDFENSHEVKDDN